MQRQHDDQPGRVQLDHQLLDLFELVQLVEQLQLHELQHELVHFVQHELVHLVEYLQLDEQLELLDLFEHLQQLQLDELDEHHVHDLMHSTVLRRARPLVPRATAILFAASWLAASAGASTISLDVRTTCGFEPVAARCEVAISNRGDETARELSVALLAGQTGATRGSHPNLAPGETWKAGLELDPEAVPPGRSPVLVRVDYQDEGGYPLSALSHGTLLRDQDPQARPAWRATLESVTLRDEPATVSLRIESAGGTSKPFIVRLVLPRELGVTGPATIRLEPGRDGPIETSFRVENRTAFAGSSYEILALVETGFGGSRESIVAPATVRIAAPLLPTERVRPALLALLVLLAIWIAVRLRRASVRSQPLSSWGGRLLDASVLVALLAYLAALVPGEQVLTPTTTAGGDTASHVLTAKYLAETLLPEGRILGWMPGNLGGYPIFQLYFPLPFLLAVALTPLVELAVGFKLVTLAGTFLLPLCAYVAFRQLGFERPAPALAAATTIPFLLVETNTVFGGNLPSTLAGEFAYSLGLALAVLFLGTSFRGLVERRHLVPNAILLALVGLSHAYALLLAGAFAAGHLLWLPGLRRNASYLARLYLLAFALIGFWILPLLGYAEFTSPYRDLWQIESWREVLPPILLPLLAVVLIAVALAARRRGKAEPDAPLLPARVGTLLTAAAIGVLLFRLAPLLGAVDIRFLPAVQLGIAVLAAPALGALARRLRPVPAATWLFVGALLLWTDAHVGFVPQWMRWNFSGFESKPLWAEFSEVQRRLAGDATDPRVVFEHSPAHNAAGSIRAFESLPLFSGRSTLEGLYIQSSLNTPEIFYLQSEISEVASCPLPDFHCGRLDPERAAEHLRQFNVDRVVARSRAVRSALRASDQYELVAEVPPYEIHRVRGGDDRYVVPLDRAPVPIATSNWKGDFFRWFKRPGSSRVALVNVPGTGAADLARFGPALDRLPELADSAPLDASGVRVEESIAPHRIEIRTSRPGHPLLIRVSYHPRWRSLTGEPVHLASPGFLLVVPRGREVVLEFGDPPLVRLGHLLTLLGALVVLLALGRGLGGRRGPSAALEPEALGPARLVARLGFLVAVVALAWAATAGGADSFPPRLYERGLELYKQERFEAAALELDRAVAAGPLSSAALHASFYRALCAYRMERWEEAAALFERAIESFPESPYHAEARYHVGLCLRNLGDRATARIAFRTVTARFPDSDWSVRAAERLTEVDPPAPEENRHDPT